MPSSVFVYSIDIRVANVNKIGHPFKILSTVAIARPDRNSLQNVSLMYGIAYLVISLIFPPYLPLSIV